MTPRHHRSTADRTNPHTTGHPAPGTARPTAAPAARRAPRRPIALALALMHLLSLPALALAQGGDGSDTNGSAPHDHTMDGGTMDGEPMDGTMDHDSMGDHTMDGHTMDDHTIGDQAMGGHRMMDMHADAAGTTVTLGDATLRVEPLIVVSPDGLRASLVLAFDAAAPAGLTATLTAPDGTATPAAVDAGDDPTSPSLAWASGTTLPTGLWTLELRAGDADAVVPIEVLHATGEDSVEGLLVMAPAPSMATMGGTTAYLTVYRDGEDVHADPTLQRHMAGMQHSTDTEVVELQHVHAAAPGGGEAMPNVAAVSFAMVGTWSVDVTLQTSPPQVLHFDAEVRTP